ncbi:MAG: response regulator [Deltaproteobacteria bacterium]|nr:response regulator [Deltaproteobacteria bacterium]
MELSGVILRRRGPPLLCAVENLSAGGALLCADSPLDDDGPIRVRLRLSPNREVSVTAHVVRRHPGVDGRHRFAIAFADLPPRVEDMMQSAALRALAATRSTVSVLVVDDEAVVRTSLARELRSLGATAREAASAFDAVVDLQRVRPAVDVAIVDAHLDPGDGLEVLRHVQAEHPEVHRVLMSGRMRPSDLANAHASGLAHQVIAKPWQQTDLRRALRHGR